MRIQTKTLLLRPLLPSDAPALAEAVTFSLPKLRPWLAWAKQYEENNPLAEAAKAIDFFEKQAQREEKLNLGVFLLDGTFIGSSGFWPHDEPGVYEIGYWLDTRFTGQGLMTHAVEAQTKYLFEKLGATCVEIRCHAGNSNSMKVALSAGFKMNREIPRDNFHDDDKDAVTKVFVHTPESWAVHDRLA